MRQRDTFRIFYHFTTGYKQITNAVKTSSFYVNTFWTTIPPSYNLKYFNLLLFQNGVIFAPLHHLTRSACVLLSQLIFDVAISSKLLQMAPTQPVPSGHVFKKEKKAKNAINHESNKNYFPPVYRAKKKNQQRLINLHLSYRTREVGVRREKYAPCRDNARELSSPDALLQGPIDAGLTVTFFMRRCARWV